MRGTVSFLIFPYILLTYSRYRPFLTLCSGVLTGGYFSYLPIPTIVCSLFSFYFITTCPRCSSRHCTPLSPHFHGKPPHFIQKPPTINGNPSKYPHFYTPNFPQPFSSLFLSPPTFLIPNFISLYSMFLTSPTYL